VKPLPVALAAICFVIAVLYAAGILQIGAGHPGKHFSHAALFGALGVLALVWGRFSSASAPKRP
jgi:hypothetical protein